MPPSGKHQCFFKIFFEASARRRPFEVSLKLRLFYIRPTGGGKQSKRSGRIRTPTTFHPTSTIRFYQVFTFLRDESPAGDGNNYIELTTRNVRIINNIHGSLIAAPQIIFGSGIFSFHVSIRAVLKMVVFFKCCKKCCIL